MDGFLRIDGCIGLEGCGFKALLCGLVENSREQIFGFLCFVLGIYCLPVSWQ